MATRSPKTKCGVWGRSIESIIMRSVQNPRGFPIPIDLALGRLCLKTLANLTPVDIGRRGDSGVESFEIDASAHK